MNNDKYCHRKLLPFGERLQELMKLHNEGYEDICSLIDPNYSTFEGDDKKAFKNKCLKYIRNRMSGQTKISLKELEILADHYNVTMDYLLNRKDAETGLSSDAVDVIRNLCREETLMQFTQLERLLTNKNQKRFLTQLSILYLENTIIREIANRGKIEDGEYIHFEKERAARYSVQTEFELILHELYPLTPAPEQKI